MKVNQTTSQQQYFTERKVLKSHYAAYLLRSHAKINYFSLRAVLPSFNGTGSFFTILSQENV